MRSGHQFAAHMLGAIMIEATLAEFRKLKKWADRAIAQVRDEDLFATLDTESNSIAVIMKHLAGNMRSRWSDFLSSDGEKPDRNRDMEFLTEPGDTRESRMEQWETGWRCVFETLESLTPGDLHKTVFVRAQPQPALEAIQRQLRHCAYHVGQIVFLAKHFAGNNWQTLTIPRGKSREFNTAMRPKRT